MKCSVVTSEHAPDSYRPINRAVYLILLLWCGTVMLAQNSSKPASSSAASELRVMHILGFEGAKNNAKGQLSIKDDELRFQKDGSPAVPIKISSIQDVLLGEQSRETGGTAATVGKTATPFGGGRVISLFAHKKYDALTLEYIDGNGGFHGAVFFLDKGQGQAFKDELEAKGAHVAPAESQSAKQNNTEVKSENK